MRHCFIVGTRTCGQREDTIIGSSCVTNPAWTVPCYPADFEGVDCVPSLAEEAEAVAAAFAEVQEMEVTLGGLTTKLVTFS